MNKLQTLPKVTVLYRKYKKFESIEDYYHFFKKNKEYVSKNLLCVIIKDFGKMYFTKGKLDCYNGPAVEYADGGKEWWINGLLHREDGPAIEWSDGTKYWYINGFKHRENGPTYKEWYINNKELTEEKFLSMTKISSGPTCCKTCNTINEYADANQLDGSYVCYNCR